MNRTKASLTVLVLLALGLALGGGKGCSIVGPSPGPRMALIVRESFDDTAAQSRMFTDLRSGPQAKYLTEKGHSLSILDDDAKDQDGKPLAILGKLGVAGKFPDNAHIPPELLIIAPPDKLLDKQTLTPDATAETVVSAIKAKGG